MVLQRDTKITIWGWAKPGEKVSCPFKDKTYAATTGADSLWTVILPAQKAGGSYDMEITGSNHLTIKNILIGDVWVCSGQLNMKLPMANLYNKKGLPASAFRTDSW